MAVRTISDRMVCPRSLGHIRVSYTNTGHVSQLKTGQAGCTVWVSMYMPLHVCSHARTSEYFLNREKTADDLDLCHITVLSFIVKTSTIFFFVDFSPITIMRKLHQCS